MAARRARSKRRSGSPSHPWPPDPVTLFIDECLGRRVIPQALRDAGCQVLTFDSVFAPGTHDVAWLEKAGQEGWIVITKDDRIRRRWHERAVVSRCNVALFTLKFRKDGSGPEMADVLVRALPRIHRFLARHRPPFIAKITRRGVVAMEVDL